MKTQKVLFIAGVFLSVLSGIAVAATSTGVDLGARYHTKHSEFVSLPYADGDWTYTAGYEINEENSMLQIVCGFTPEFQDNKDLDYGITPELNLLAKDGIYQGGLGILSTYTPGSGGSGDWMDMYWQWILGLNVPLGSRLSLQANAYYVFEDWGSLSKFKFDDIEFGGSVCFKF
jgi:hypothetical protein